MGDILFLLALLGFTFLTGTIIEKQHFKNIQKREIALIKKPIINFGAKTWHTNKKIKKIELVTGTIRTSHYLRQFPTHLLQGNQSRYR